MARLIYVVLSVSSLLGFAGCTAEVRPETPHEARAERREEHREAVHEERREERHEDRGY
jgi:hypothetical protein